MAKITYMKRITRTRRKVKEERRRRKEEEKANACTQVHAAQARHSSVLPWIHSLKWFAKNQLTKTEEKKDNKLTKQTNKQTNKQINKQTNK